MERNWSFSVRALHWLSALLVIGCVGAVWGHELFVKGDPMRTQMMLANFALGGLIAGVTWVRIAVRTNAVAPTHAMPRWMTQSSKLVHVALYGLLVALPVLGYMSTASHESPSPVLATFSLPTLPYSASMAHGFKELHEGMASLLLVVLALHVGAVVLHAVVLKDKVLPSMLGRS
jgi:cytochrome b561